jgi:fibronectin-binding autotransporter adhesin
MVLTDDFVFNRGTLRLTGGDLSLESTGLFGNNLTVDLDKIIEIAANMVIGADGRLVLNGGTVAANAAINDGEIVLADPTTLLTASALMNRGTMSGTGRINATLENASIGFIRVGTGDRFVLDAVGNTNAGTIIIESGGDIDFHNDLTNSSNVTVQTDGSIRSGGILTNATTGFIAGSGSIFRFDGSLLNDGTLGIAHGASSVVGNVINRVGGLISIGGTGTVSFFGNVVNDGSISVGPGSKAIFLGDVSGGGQFPSSGIIELSGDVSPGSSTATVSFGGDVLMGGGATLVIELAGLAAGTDYDQVSVAGDLLANGALEIILMDGLAPTIGDEFDVLDFGSFSGGFGRVTVPVLPSGLSWDIATLSTNG